MTIDDLGNIGDFLGGIAVLISVIYLALQIRQNTREVKHASTQDLLGKSVDVFTHALGTSLPALLAKLEKTDDLSNEERQYFSMWLRRNMQLFELVYLQYREGRVTQEIMDAYERRIIDHMARPQWDAEWVKITHTFTKSYSDYITRLTTQAER